MVPEKILNEFYLLFGSHCSSRFIFYLKDTDWKKKICDHSSMQRYCYRLFLSICQMYNVENTEYIQFEKYLSSKYSFFTFHIWISQESVTRICYDNTCEGVYIPRCQLPLLTKRPFFDKEDDHETLLYKLQFPYLEHVIIINLQNRPERRRSLIHHLDQRMPLLKYSFQSPVEAKSSYESLILTNLSILKTALLNQWNYVCILEDDCRFHQDFTELYPDIIQRIPLNWKMLFLGIKEYDGSVIQETSYVSLLHRKNCGSHAILYHYSIYQDIIDFYETNRCFPPYDEGLKQLFHKKKISCCYVLQPNLVITLCGEDSESDIQSKEKHAKESYSFWNWNKDNYI